MDTTRASLDIIKRCVSSAPHPTLSGLLPSLARVKALGLRAWSLRVGSNGTDRFTGVRLLPMLQLDKYIKATT